ncbi:MAG: hypothetical protein D6682_01365 [Zetaproteobacteria bacterium]|nr:MAG: hypothetical protein D6682_01365 [Zetaproteobacteria bacterium]
MADLILLIVIVLICWRGYHRRSWWFVLPVGLWIGLGRGRGMWLQLLLFGPVVVGWLLLCHWVNTHGWHATAAGGILFAMTVGLQAMRSFEEEQKQAREPGAVELES